MGRPTQPEIGERILDRCTDFVLERGLPESLEPFAEASGVSKRMLLYHFGTRDGLLRAVLGRARERQLADWGGLLAGREGVPYPDVLAEAWASMTGPDGAGYLRLFGQLRQNAEQRLWPGFQRLATTDWLAPLETGLRAVGQPELATLVLAVLRGLLLDLEATGDLPRTTDALDRFLRSLPAD